MTSIRELRPLGENAWQPKALGVDLSRTRLMAKTLAWVEDAFAEQPGAGVPRNRIWGPAELAAFGRLFGKPKIHSRGRLPARRASGSVVANQCRPGRQDRLVRGQAGATDCIPTALMRTCRRVWRSWHAKEVPSSKGGTMFADMRAAYDALDDAMKERLRALTGLHGRHDGPYGGTALRGPTAEQNLDRKYPDEGAPGGGRPPGHRAGRSSLSTRCTRHGFAGDGQRRRMGADRGAGPSIFDAGSLRLLPFVAGRRRF